MATLENRGNGSWRITVSGGYGPDGKQIRIKKTIHVNPDSTEGAQRKQVEREAAALETDYRRHLITESKKIRLADVCNEYLESKPMAASTKAGYRALFDRRLIPQLGRVYVQDLTSKQIRDFYKYLANDDARPAHKVSKKADKQQPKTRSKTGKLSGTSRKHYHQALSAVLNFAVRSGYITVNPIIGVDPPRQDTPEKQIFEYDDMKKLMDVLDNYQDPMWRAFFTLCIYTGCRPGEIIALNWSDLDGNVITIRAGSNHIKGQGTIRTDRPKTKSSIRTIIIPPEALQPLMKWKSAQAEYRLQFRDCWPEPEAMFTGDTGCRLYISTPTHKWREIQMEYHLKDVPLYSFRHTALTYMIYGGCTVAEVARQAGHSRQSTTMDFYSHEFEQANQHAADVMSAAIKAARRAE